MYALYYIPKIPLLETVKIFVIEPTEKYKLFCFNRLATKAEVRKGQKTGQFLDSKEILTQLGSLIAHIKLQALFEVT
jgi:hypothetical protein